MLPVASRPDNAGYLERVGWAVAAMLEADAAAHVGNRARAADTLTRGDRRIPEHEPKPLRRAQHRRNVQVRRQERGGAVLESAHLSAFHSPPTSSASPCSRPRSRSPGRPSGRTWRTSFGSSASTARSKPWRSHTARSCWTSPEPRRRLADEIFLVDLRYRFFIMKLDLAPAQALVKAAPISGKRSRGSS
jgi:hypothetical protein